MRCGHLFNGIGGFALSAHWMGWENVMHCEIDPFCNKVMNYHFPKSIQYEDIRHTTFSIYKGKIDLLTGGFPCQPYSSAGKRKGKDDPRHLWPEMLRAIHEIRPHWVVGENVRGLISWNGGLVFDEVQSDLEAEGYEVLPFLLPAASVNAPHRRDRIWFIAHSNRNGYRSNHRFEQTGCQTQTTEGKKQWEGRNEAQRERDGSIIRGTIAKEITPNTQSIRMEGNRSTEFEEPQIQTGSKLSRCDNSGDYWKEWPTQPPICGGDDGLSRELAGITFSKWRQRAIKAAGNAIVPQIAFQIFKAIEKYEQIWI